MHTKAKQNVKKDCEAKVLTRNRVKKGNWIKLYA